MGRTVRKVSPTLGSLLRGARRRRRWTLQQVSERLAREGETIPPSTLGRIESGLLDPGAPRLLQLMRLYDIDAESAVRAVEADQPRVEKLARDADLKELLDTGIRCWRAGEIDRAIRALQAARSRDPESETPRRRRLRQEAALAYAGVLRSLGRQRQAKQILDELLLEPPDDSLVDQVLTLSSSVWRALGSLEMALAVIRQAATHLGPGKVRKFAWVLHQEAKLLVEMKRAREADSRLAHALRHYRSADDEHGELRALLLRVGVLEALEKVPAARRLAAEVARRAEAGGHRRVAANARLELGRLRVGSGQVRRGIDELRAGLAEAVRLGDRNAQFFAHHRLWKAYLAAGSGDEAAVELAAAKELAGLIEDEAPEVVEVRGIAGDGSAELGTESRRRSRSAKPG